MMKRKLAIITGLAFLFLATASANTLPIEDGFEDGDFSEWTETGDSAGVPSITENAINGDYSLTMTGQHNIYRDWDSNSVPDEVGYTISVSEDYSPNEDLSFGVCWNGNDPQEEGYQTCADSGIVGNGVGGIMYDPKQDSIHVGNSDKSNIESRYNAVTNLSEYGPTRIEMRNFTVQKIEMWDYLHADIHVNGTEVKKNQRLGIVSDSLEPNYVAIFHPYADNPNLKVDDITYGTVYIGPPQIESASAETPVVEGEYASFDAEIKNGERVRVIVEQDGNQVANQSMETVDKGIFEANDVFRAGGGEYTYTIKAENQFGETDQISGSFITQTPSFIVGQKVEGSISDAFNVTPDYEYKDGDVTYYYTKDYVYHDGSVVEESNWNRIDNFGSYTGEQTEKTISNEINRDAESTGNYSVETKLVEVSSTYEWDQDNDGVLDDSQGWEPYDTETVGTIRYNYQVVKAMETPSALDALGNFFDSILDGMISTITDIFSSEPTAVPNPDNPPVPQSN